MVSYCAVSSGDGTCGGSRESISWTRSQSESEPSVESGFGIGGSGVFGLGVLFAQGLHQAVKFRRRAAHGFRSVSRPVLSDIVLKIILGWAGCSQMATLI